MIEGVILLILLYISIAIVSLLQHLQIRRQKELIEKVSRIGAFPEESENSYFRNLRKMNISSLEQFDDYLVKRLVVLKNTDRLLGKKDKLLTILLFCLIVCLIVTIGLIFVIHISLPFVILVELFIIALLIFLIVFLYYNKMELDLVSKYLDVGHPGN